MQVNYGFLCDYASISREGKLSIMGIFSNIAVQRLPATHAQAYLAFEIGLHYGEVGRSFPIRIECRDQDGREVFKLQGTLQAEGEAGPKDKPKLQQIFGITGLSVQREGPHDINFFLNDQLMHTIEFTVTKLPSADTGSGPGASAQA